MSKWERTTPITEAEADAEPLDQQLFGPDYDRRMREIEARGERQVTIDRDPWRGVGKPRIERPAARRTR